MSSAHPQAASVLYARMPWLFDSAAAESPWSLVVRSLAHVAMHAKDDTAAEQGAEEAMRLLHAHVKVWEPATLAAAVAAAQASLFAGDLVPCVHRGEAVQLPPAVLARLLSRFQTYLPSLWTLLVAEYSALGADTLRALLECLLVLLHVPDLDVIRTGVVALHQMSVVVAGNGGAELDQAGWDAIVQMLQKASSMDTVGALPLALRIETVILVQQRLAQLLQHCERSMPPQTHLALLATLQASVDRAAEASSSAESAAMHGNIEPEAQAHAAPAHAGRANGRLASTAHSGSPVHAGNGRASGDTSPPPQPDSGASSAAEQCCNGMRHDRQPNLAHARLCFRRQQNHGGELAVQLYLAALRMFKASAARTSALAEPREAAVDAHNALQAFSQTILCGCAASCSPSGGDQAQWCAWSAHENAPVLCAVLHALRELQLAQHSKCDSQLMGILTGLMRCGRPDVRATVADVMESVVWPQLQGVLAA